LRVVRGRIAVRHSCKRAASAFPASGTITGWDKVGDTRSFSADTLSQYIDGGADQYVDAGVGTTYTSDYKYQGTIEAVVDVYSMKTPDGAKKIFDGDPAIGSKTVELGDAARLYASSVVSAKDATWCGLRPSSKGPIRQTH